MRKSGFEWGSIIISLIGEMRALSLDSHTMAIRKVAVSVTGIRTLFHDKVLDREREYKSLGRSAQEKSEAKVIASEASHHFERPTGFGWCKCLSPSRQQIRVKTAVCVAPWTSIGVAKLCLELERG